MNAPIKDFSSTWLTHLKNIISKGEQVKPRHKMTRELAHSTIEVNMRHPVLRVPKRGLSYQFMAAEAYWILTGDYRVETIAPYNKAIAQFSDDGQTFFGAYGPKIKAQLPYVVNKLLKDRASRQAGLTIWRESPIDSKDIPCTVSIFFNIRKGFLNCHVFMRSSDVWLGVPYDVFNFSMLSHLVCALLNEQAAQKLVPTEPGTLYLTAASSHLYELNLDAALTCLESQYIPVQDSTPSQLFRSSDALFTTLKELRDSKPGDHRRWWEVSKDET